MIFKNLFNWNKLFKHLIRYKIYVDRARWYIAFAQFVMMTAVYFQVAGLEMTIIRWILVSIGVILISLILGFIDVKIFNAMKEEQRQYSEQNPVIMEIHKMVKELKDNG